jgi:hypothetical protein
MTRYTIQTCHRTHPEKNDFKYRLIKDSEDDVISLRTIDAHLQHGSPSVCPRKRSTFSALLAYIFRVGLDKMLLALDV